MAMHRPDTEAVDLATLRTTLKRLNAKIEAGDQAPQIPAEEESPQDFREAQQLLERFLQRTQEMPLWTSSRRCRRSSRNCVVTSQISWRSCNAT